MKKIKFAGQNFNLAENIKELQMLCPFCKRWRNRKQVISAFTKAGYSEVSNFILGCELPTKPIGEFCGENSSYSWAYILCKFSDVKQIEKDLSLCLSSDWLTFFEDNSGEIFVIATEIA